MLSSALVRDILDSLPDAILITDSTGCIRFANRQVSEIFGYASGDLIGKPVELLLPARFRGRHVDQRKGYTDNVRVRPMGSGLDLLAMRKDGTEFPVEISLSPVRQGEEILVAAAIRDVTERKRAEEALEAARREADQANHAKSRFLATASHDLRQPLQSLALLNGALRRMVNDADCREMLAQQDQAVSAMSRLLNALLDISKLESGAIRPEISDFEIAPLFEEIRREFHGIASSKGLRFSIDSPGELARSDPALIGQVLRNLVSNAIKYTPAGSVELRCVRRDSRLRIEVRDTGVGFSADQASLIFDEFYQIGVSPNSSRDGYGLGLSIVQRIAKLLGFTIEVNSVPGAGSVFAFELPWARHTAGGLAPDSRTVRTGDAVTNGRLLLVEDEKGVLNAMRMLLEIEGYHVAAAATTDEALTHLRAAEDGFDLVITDYHLDGGRTGTQVIAAAREMLGFPVKAILVTGDTSSLIRELKGDANLRIISKPINSDELLQLVKSMLAV